VAAVFGWDRELLEGLTPEARHWREQQDNWWTNRLGIVITPRWVLQYWGTEVCRHGFHDDIWIAALENRLRSRTGNTVISDVRFPNEISSIKNAGGQIIWVQRGVMPHWYELAIKANRGDTKAHQWLIDNKIHASETAWVGTDFDHVIDNNKSVENLYNTIKNLVQ